MDERRLISLCKRNGTTAEGCGAVRFERDVLYTIVEVRSRDEEDVMSVLLRARLDDDLHVELLHVFEFGVHAWVADAPDEHRLLLSGGRLALVRGSEVAIAELDLPGFVGAMAALDEETLVLAGEEGLLATWCAGEIGTFDIDTEEDLVAVTGTAGAIVVGGTYGTLLEQGRDRSFTTIPLIDTESRPRVSAVMRGLDGAILAGLDDGRVCHVVGGKVEWLAVERADRARIFAMATFADHELVGDDDCGVWRRIGTRLERAVETGAAFHLDARDDRLTIDAGRTVVLIDGDLDGPRRTLSVHPKPEAWLRRER